MSNRPTSPRPVLSQPQRDVVFSRIDVDMHARIAAAMRGCAFLDVVHELALGFCVHGVNASACGWCRHGATESFFVVDATKLVEALPAPKKGGAR